jgi:ectoine hydroxylase-related dioxygenase (phytanoyl-CoA dioxygenase family)
MHAFVAITHTKVQLFCMPQRHKMPSAATSLFNRRHQDAAYWPPLQSDTAAANCWLALSNISKENGCLRYVPGSHLEPELRRHRPGDHEGSLQDSSGYQ